MKVWVVTGISQSSDHYDPVVFSKKPTDKQLKKLAHDWDGDEDEQGEGDYGSFVELNVVECEVDVNDNKLMKENEKLKKELQRFKDGNITSKEIHNMCHNLCDTVSRKEFEEGCRKYQEKLYGKR